MKLHTAGWNSRTAAELEMQPPSPIRHAGIHSNRSQRSFVSDSAVRAARTSLASIWSTLQQTPAFLHEIRMVWMIPEIEDDLATPEQNQNRRFLVGSGSMLASIPAIVGAALPRRIYRELQTEVADVSASELQAAAEEPRFTRANHGESGRIRQTGRVED